MKITRGGIAKQTTLNFGANKIEESGTIEKSLH